MAAEFVWSTDRPRSGKWIRFTQAKGQAPGTWL